MRSRTRLLAVLVVAVVALSGCIQAPSDGAPGSAGVPVMGQSRLSAAQLVAYYNARSHPAYRAEGVTLDQLAQMFVDEGNRYNVRGDIAFAQSIIETGWFNYPDCDGCQLRPSSYNYSGIGACGGCADGHQFSSPLAGVRAQIQLLRNMADDTSRVTTIPDAPVPELWGADPTNANRNFDRYSFKGRAPLWNDMTGVWASSPVYAPTVLSVYNQMLTQHDVATQCPGDVLLFGGLPQGGPCPVELRQPGRAIARTVNDGYYVLNGNGDVSAHKGAPYYGGPTFGADWARDIAAMPDGNGYVVLAGDGGVSKFGSANRPDTLGALGNPSWFPFDQARSIAITPDGGGYVILDAHGGVWKYGTAASGPLAALSNPSWPDNEPARAIDVMADGAGYVVLDNTGGVWKYGSATVGLVGTSSTPWFGWTDTARDIYLVNYWGFPLGYLVLDSSGQVWSAGLAPTVSNPKATPGFDRWRGLSFHGDRPIVVKNDGSVVATS